MPYECDSGWSLDHSDIKQIVVETKARILEELGVGCDFDAKSDAEARIQFLADYLKNTGKRAYVLGVSGGIDSTTSGLLAQAACSLLRDVGYPAELIAVRLPHGVQADDIDAQRALSTIKPDRVMTVNIEAPTTEMMMEIPVTFADASHADFVKGNIKARQRMVAQYAIAGAVDGLVIGTDHNAEAVMGFFTKYGDGACDVAPLVGLNKRRVREVGSYLGAPKHLVEKVPTADLEDLNPGKPDEEAYGVTYDEIDDFLEGKIVSDEVEFKIAMQFRKTAHKRSLPISP